MKKSLLCLEYSEKISRLNRQTAAFDEHTTFCADCGTKVFISKSSLALLASDDEIKAVCGNCAAKMEQLSGKPKFAVTREQFQEVLEAHARMAARKN